MALGKPCGAVIPRYHPPLWLSEGCKRNSRAPLVRRLFLAFRPSPSHHRGDRPALEYEPCPRRSERGVSRLFGATGDRHGGNPPPLDVV